MRRDFNIFIGEGDMIGLSYISWWLWNVWIIAIEDELKEEWKNAYW